MLPEIELDVLQYFDRTSLEALQMHSRYLRDSVNRHAHTLPLRYIQEVYIAYGVVRIQLQKGLPFDWIRVVSPGDQVLEVLFHRVNNAFLPRLTLSFVRENLHLLYYLRANANALQCRIRTLRFKGPAVEIDYALVDFLGACFKPQIYKTELCSASYVEEYTMLFMRDALRGYIAHLEYQLDAAPACLIPALFGVDVVDTCAITTDAEPRPWIVKFIETFEMAERGVEIVRSVTLIHTCLQEALPVRLDIEPFGHPRGTDVPTPQSPFIKQWSLSWDESDGIITAESPVAKLFVFANAKLAKKLEVFAWDIEQSGKWFAFHRAFQINVIDM